MGLLTPHRGSDNHLAAVSALVSLFPLQQATGLVPWCALTTAIRLIREQLLLLLISQVQNIFKISLKIHSPIGKTSHDPNLLLDCSISAT